ncbi:MAG TPA: tetratricopeptide repeat protein [Terriglobales bacterium]|jgi:tetratricopeptide (TPR) repeat protein|nr:tetratricopeptide repeat protein [Terriglobales bacterium]
MMVKANPRSEYFLQEEQRHATRSKLDEDAMNFWASTLMEENHLPEAIDLFKLDVQLFPNSPDAYDSLGEAYMKAGQKQLAIDNYKKALELNPANDDAKEKLKVLEREVH